MSSRRQLSMVLPQALISAIKQRASDQGISITAYITELVRRDLSLPAAKHAQQPTEGDDTPANASSTIALLAAEIEELRQRINRLEHRLATP